MIKLIDMLYSYEPWDDQEAQVRDRFFKFVNGNPNCFESTHPPRRGEEAEEDMGHITGSAWVLDSDRKSVLLTHHKKLNKWLQLGGHSDGESNVIKTALREAIEESGIQKIRLVSEDIFDIDVHEFPQKKGALAHLHYDVRFCFIAEHENFVISDESNNLSWVPVEEIHAGDFEKSLKRMASKSLKLASANVSLDI